MNILIAVDSFKGTLTSIQAAEIIEKVFRVHKHNVQSVPIADGGEGTIDSIFYNLGGKKKFVQVSNPIGKKIKTYYILKNDIAYLEFAKTSGIMLLKKTELDPLKTSSYGFGELLNSVIENNIKEIVIGLGGSATNDAGIGMLSALGVKFYDKNGNEIKNLNKCGGEILEKIYDFDTTNLNPLIKNVNINILCDVKNPLYGKDGTSKIYSPQKGADASCVIRLEKGVVNFARIMEKKFKTNVNFEGAGAAGGMGAALKIFLNANIVQGIKGIIKLFDIENKIIESDLVITGEGAMDIQTTFGKAPVGIAELAKKHNKKVVAICGKTGKNAKELFNHGIDFIFSCYGDVALSADFLKRNAKKNLTEASKLAADKINDYEKTKNRIYIVNETQNFRDSPNTGKRHKNASNSLRS